LKQIFVDDTSVTTRRC